MATRFFCNANLWRFRNTYKQVSQLHQHAFYRPLLLQSNSQGVGALVSSVQLHVKVFDKDAGLKEQRKANRDKTEQPLVFPVERLSVQRSEVKNFNKERQQRTEVKAKDEYVPNSDADIFGGASTFAEETEDAGDVAEEEYLSNSTRRTKKLRTKEYALLIKEHLYSNRLKEAINVLERRMLKEDRVKPENYIFNLLISGCAKAGYTRKAFSLFTKMRQRGLKVTGGTYTSLFNACANAPSAVDGLARANNLREIMLEKGYEPNEKNYNAMIKAYGRCGDVKTAYLLADEMMERQLPVNTDTFNFLLQACASDAEFGFRHCLLTWHKMLQRGISPDYYTFNTVLRCVRDSDFGDLQTMHQVLKQILAEKPVMRVDEGATKFEELKLLEEGNIEQEAKPMENPFCKETKSTSVSQSLTLKNESTQLEVPNLLTPRPHLGSLVSLAEVKLPHERFLLLGGLQGFLELMKTYNITPDIQTFTTILEVVPPTNAAEKQVISYIRRIGLKADIDFFNVLIKKRSMRFDYENAKEVLSMIKTAGLHADIVTYGVLSLGCRTEQEARELLQQMSHNGVRMNMQILGAMLRQGTAQKNFTYVIEIIQISLDEHIKPNDVFLRHLHNFYNQCARAIDARHPWTKTKSFKKSHGKFCDKLRLYYEEQGIAGLKLEDAIKKIKERPYAQYQSEEAIEGIEPTKNTELTKKQKLRKYIKKIKLNNLRDDGPGEDIKTKRIE